MNGSTRIHNASDTSHERIFAIGTSVRTAYYGEEGKAS